jgi:uncharacterized membrane protein
MPTKTSVIFCRVLTYSLLTFAFVITAFRASVQSIAHDEALTYEWFLDGSVYKVLAFNSTNHVLFTVLAKLFVKVLGVTELHIRAPSLIGTAAYLVFSYLLCRTLFGNGFLLPISVTMLCLNPQILDFMAAGRGYILGMACFTASMYFVLQAMERGEFNSHDPEWRRSCVIASFFLALSVTSNLTNLFPSASLTLAFALVALPGALGLGRAERHKLRIFSKYVILPGLFLGLSLLWPFLIQARPVQFNMGAHRVVDSVRDFFNASFLYKWTGDIYSTSLGAVPPSPGSWQARVSDAGVYVLLPLLFCFVAVALFFVSHSRLETRRKQTLRCQLFGGAATACVGLTFVLHVLVKVNYPVSRTCLYFISLFSIGGLLLAQELSFRIPSSPLKVLGLAVAICVLFDYAISLNTKYFRYNAYDAISRDLFWAIETDARSKGLSRVRMGGTWWYEPELNFYRRRYHAEWMMPYDVKDRSYSWESPDSLASPADYDYFVFTPANDPGLTGPRVKTIFRDEVTGLTVTAMSK